MSLSSKGLTKNKRGSYSKDDILQALDQVGIKQGSTVYVSTSLGLIGYPPENICNNNQLCEFFYNVICEAIGEEGTFIVPAYSYTFGKGTEGEPPVFDPDTTPADIGAFPNFVLKQAGIQRSLDPMVSVACKGKRCREFIENIPNTSYGEGSFLSRLAKSDAKLLNLGIGPIWLPFVHYIDWVCKAPYRFDKKFKGLIKKGSEVIPAEWTYYSRVLKDNTHPSTDKVGRMAEQAGLWQSAPLGKTNIYSIVCREYFDFVKRHVEKDPWILVKGPAFKPTKEQLT